METVNTVKRNTTLVFENFKLLKNDMEENGWVIEAFTFNYKKANYIVLARLYQADEKRPKYALLKTEIINEEDFASIILPVNSNGFMTDAKTLCEFFNIAYSLNIGDILQQLTKYFASFIPNQINPKKSEGLKIAMASSLSKSDSKNPNKMYCFNVKRNKSNEKRTIFNDNKTRLLRPSLYTKFKDDLTISFCYSQNKNEEETDEEILLKFSKRI